MLCPDLSDLPVYLHCVLRWREGGSRIWGKPVARVGLRGLWGGVRMPRAQCLDPGGPRRPQG